MPAFDFVILHNVNIVIHETATEILPAHTMFVDTPPKPTPSVAI
jgi:hypothetical protein